MTRLRSALERHAITLPSLRADHPVAGLPLIELGRCNQQTVEKLIAALTGQAGPDCGLGAEADQLGQASA
ncbi:hypothetical protein I2501_01345 [Streptacidiphilus sp. NEAU-YB345]|uniref:Uncharacterized protein n=1 Tax=Streptacidiphilus fuscans TaxID=2789292 RepID=A0A931FCN9_9ACTN|nr:hypothetical protein [Streptacidiphilus fuscans]